MLISTNTLSKGFKKIENVTVTTTNNDRHT